MRASDILLIFSGLASSGLSCTSKAPTEATEVPAGSPRNSAENSCRHDLGRCGGHKPGDGACGGSVSVPSKPDAPTPASIPLDDVVIEPGNFAEINFDMAVGSATDVTFHVAGGPLEWNVHSHDGDKVATHAEGTGTDGQVRFAAPNAGLFSYLWKNTGSMPVRLTARLSSQGAVRVHSIHPAP